MKIIKYLGLISLILFSSSCSAKTPSVQTQDKEQDTNKVQTTSIPKDLKVSEIKPKQNNRITRKEKLPQKVVMSNLANGNYLFCPEPPNPDKSSNLNVDGFCFSFRKTNNRIIGRYFPGLPKGDRAACIVGFLKGNIVTGIAYELTQGSSKPSQPKDIKNMSYDTNWDGKGNLTVKSPRLYSTEKSLAGDYWWELIRYDSIQLNLDNFYQYKSLDKFIPPAKCPN